MGSVTQDSLPVIGTNIDLDLPTFILGLKGQSYSSCGFLTPPTFILGLKVPPLCRFNPSDTIVSESLQVVFDPPTFILGLKVQSLRRFPQRSSWGTTSQQGDSFVRRFSRTRAHPDDRFDLPPNLNSLLCLKLSRPYIANLQVVKNREFLIYYELEMYEANAPQTRDVRS